MLILLTCCVLSACSRAGSEHPLRITASADLDQLIGHRVELVGTVSGHSVPRLQGVDVWGMEHLRGQRVRVSGVLQRTVFFPTSGDAGRAADSGNDGFISPVYRGTGTFYRLQDSRYERYPPA